MIKPSVLKKTVEELYAERFITGMRACAPMLGITPEQAEHEARVILAKEEHEARVILARHPTEGREQ